MKYNSDFRFDLDFGQKGESVVAELLDNSKVEVKSERAESWDEPKKWVTTGNHFVEYESRGKPSGIQTTEAKYWVVNFCVGDEVVFGKYISTKRLLNKIPNIPVVILANKCDISTSLNAKFLEGIFRSQRKLEVFDTSTKTGEGITDVKNWICSTLECS